MESDKRARLTHKQLVHLAEKWLKARSFKVVIRDCFRAYVTTGEQPDVIAWRDGVSLVIECKTSRADFLADKGKRHRVEGGMGDWRLFLCPEGVIRQDELPSGWGLLYEKRGKVFSICGTPKSNNWYRDKPFEGNRKCENQVLVSALRRFVVRNQLDVIYEKLGAAHVE